MTSFLLGKRAGALEDHTNPEQANNEADVLNDGQDFREIVEEDATNALKQEDQESKETRDTTNNGTGTEASADLSLLMRKVTEKEQEESKKEGIDREDVLGSVVELLIDDVDHSMVLDSVPADTHSAGNLNETAGEEALEHVDDGSTDGAASHNAAHDRVAKEGLDVVGDGDDHEGGDGIKDSKEDIGLGVRVEALEEGLEGDGLVLVNSLPIHFVAEGENVLNEDDEGGDDV